MRCEAAFGDGLRADRPRLQRARQLGQVSRAVQRAMLSGHARVASRAARRSDPDSSPRRAAPRSTSPAPRARAAAPAALAGRRRAARFRATLRGHVSRVSSPRIAVRPHPGTRPLHRAKDEDHRDARSRVSSDAAIRELIDAGVDVFRFNFSHGTHEGHAEVIARVRRAAQRSGRTIALLQDLSGPKIRTGPLRGHTPLQLAIGDALTIAVGDFRGEPGRVSTTFDLPQRRSGRATACCSMTAACSCASRTSTRASCRRRSWTAVRSASTRASTFPAWSFRRPDSPRRTSPTCSSARSRAWTSSR